jgi:hypothetical protein
MQRQSGPKGHIVAHVLTLSIFATIAHGLFWLASFCDPFKITCLAVIAVRIVPFIKCVKIRAYGRYRQKLTSRLPMGGIKNKTALLACCDIGTLNCVICQAYHDHSPLTIAAILRPATANHIGAVIASIANNAVGYVMMSVPSYARVAATFDAKYCAKVNSIVAPFLRVTVIILFPFVGCFASMDVYYILPYILSSPLIDKTAKIL